MSFHYIDRLTIARPLIFLCGPAVSSDKSRDRRVILQEWISKNWVSPSAKTSGDKIHAYPIIVDEILDEKSVGSKQLKANLVEEIFAQVAYRTYIFLDTMSTSYEFGEFTNYALGDNSVRVFLDDAFKDRINCPVNQYLQMSMGGKLTLYKAEYNHLGHIFFKDDQIPISILTEIDKDNPLSGTYVKSYMLQFTPAFEPNTSVFGFISFAETNDSFEFYAHPKTWFYFMSIVQNKNVALDLFSIASPSDGVFIDFMEAVKKELFLSFAGLEKTVNKSKAWLAATEIEVNCPSLARSFSTIVRCFWG